VCTGHHVAGRYAGRTMARVLSPPETENRARSAGDDTGGTTQPTPVLPGTEWLVQRIHRPLEALWAHGFRFLFVLDAIALFGVMVAINLVRFGTDWPTYPLSHYFVGFSIATGIQLVINYFFGLYEREPRLGWRPWLPRTLLATGIGVTVQALAFVVLDRYLMPRLNLAVFLVLASMVLAGNRRISRRLAVRRQGPPRVVLVGTADDVAMAESHLADSDRGAIVVGSVPTPARLDETIRASEATDALLLDVDAFSSIFPEPLSTLERSGVGVLQRVSARETLLGLRSVRQVAGMPFVRLRVHTVPSYELAFKRLFDVVVLAVTAPVWLLVLGGLAIYVVVRGGRPIFYRQERVGRDGELFRVVKFRTMTTDAEERGPQLALKNDPRVVRGLGWMRSTRADELPQLLNVLIGHMSLVGPRPERPELARSIAARVPGYERRNELPPGLTGLAQIQGHYTTDAGYKLGYDLQYLVNWTPILDLQILAKTVWVVLSRRG
jgi:lipopolysaccharide/colanic/teichoic acid biosynthesis glycosyltransferase